MRDLTKTGFSTNSPQRSYYTLCEKIEGLESKLNRLGSGKFERFSRKEKIAVKNCR